ncbi:MAG: HNH endonuclease [Chloroflexi bacterium]|nr:HNH endonuclease [Chloroflexota bacterium]
MSAAGEPDRRDRLVVQAGGRCGYCRSSEQVTGNPLVLDHLQPRARGGTDVEANLWPACSQCNSFKQARVRARDPESGAVVPLFDPRRQRWEDHFAWTEGGRLIVGRTSTGRATVTALRLNRPLLVAARGLWIDAGLHPPEAPVAQETR